MPAAVGILVCSLLISTSGISQTRYETPSGVKITIEGTSNVHDWDMKSSKGTCSGVFELDNSGSLTGMSSLKFSVPAESLKSEHKAMDKNTRKALNTEKYSSISF